MQHTVLSCVAGRMSCCQCLGSMSTPSHPPPPAPTPPSWAIHILADKLDASRFCQPVSYTSAPQVVSSACSRWSKLGRVDQELNGVLGSGKADGQLLAEAAGTSAAAEGDAAAVTIQGCCKRQRNGQGASWSTGCTALRVVWHLPLKMESPRLHC